MTHEVICEFEQADSLMFEYSGFVSAECSCGLEFEEKSEAVEHHAAVGGRYIFKEAA